MPRLSKIGAAALAAFGWTSGSAVSASYLVVAGGGGGGGFNNGAGGGAGGLLTGTTSLNPTLSYAITVGAGGAGGNAASGNSTIGTSGGNSVFSSVTSAGGGGGSGWGGSAGPAVNGAAGGSGGGGGAGQNSLSTNGAGGAGNTPATSPSQGNNGGSGLNAASGGGGGAGATGGNASGANTAGGGGNGTASSISGSSVTYAGGGGGSAQNTGTAGTGGTGGGGAGGVNTATPTAGTANTGGGGGGAWNGPAGATGGSGVVIISYPGAQQFGGGVVTTDGTNTIHTFTTSGTLVPATPLTAQYLVVAGGAGGGGNNHTVATGGGGGAGGLLTGTGLAIDANSNYVVVVGAGGAGGTGGAGTNGVNGTNSSFSMVATAAVGGGYGATNQQAGGNGGSGGGASGPTTAGSFAGGTATSGQGNAGGSANQFQGAGGGGAGAVGGSGATGLGGDGLSSSISGTATYYAGGGGTTTASLGGGGIDGGAGTANTGGGGGRGAGGANNAGGAGGSGVVIIAYPGSTQQMAGGTVTISGGNVIHTFTSSGYLTPIKYASRSLRFRASNNAYLNRTPTVAGNRKTWTWSGWVKRGTLTTAQYLFTARSGSPWGGIVFDATATDSIQVTFTAGVSGGTYTSAFYRDPSAWYHIVVAVDTTQATAADRIKVYVNGVQITSFSSTNYPSQNFDTQFNSTIAHYLGCSQSNTENFDGYMTEVNFVDGAALTPSSFGTFNSFGVWQPITYGGSYGTNGFYLTFGNNTSTTTLGYDTSPQGNNWTTNNISVTAGATYDSMLDVPTLTSSTVNNYCVLNPLITDFTNGSGPVVVQNGNLQLYRAAATGWGMCGSTFGVSSGKWYWEATANNPGVLGIHKTQPTTYFAIVGYNEPNGYGYSSDGNKLNNNTGTAYGATYTTGDVIGMALDMDAGTLTFYKNNTSQGVAFSGLSGTFMPAFSCAGVAYWDANFGQQGFVYTPPSGFVALNTYNLSTPTIPNGAVYMAATTYTGTGAALTVANTVNGTNFQPDWVWIKNRVGAISHSLYDVVRGAGYRLSSNETTAQLNYTAQMTGFNSNGFSVATNNNEVNESGTNYVGWQWKANGTGVTNTSGSITSTVSANTTAGFAVVTYTGTGANATVGHGLGVAPSMVIVKQRNATADWVVKHASLSSNDSTLILNNASAATVYSPSVWNNTAPTSTVFSIGTNSAINTNTNTYVAYVFAAVAGYSAFGSYTGNGSADGPFVFLGFRPRFFMLKLTSGAGESWVMYDTARSTYNAATQFLVADQNIAELSSASFPFDFVSNGIKIRNALSYLNTNGATYIYMAFAENPFKYSNAR